MIRICSLIFISFIVICNSFSQSALPQGKTQANGGISPNENFYVSADYAFRDAITIGFEYLQRTDKITGYYRKSTELKIDSYIGNINYHYNNLFYLSDRWDIYSGLNFGKYTPRQISPWHLEPYWTIGVQIGARYYFLKCLALHIEAGLYGSVQSKIGLSLRI